MKLTKLSENLYSLRKRRGLSQEEFAEKIHISRQAVSKWERGEAYPDTENLIEIASFYGVTLDELVNSSDILERAMVLDEVDENDEEDDRKDEEHGLTIIIADDNEEDFEYDTDDEDNEADSERGITFKGELHLLWQDLPYPIIVTVAYLLLGFLTPRGWEIWWTLYITVPLYYSIVDCIRKRRFSPFAYPVFITFAYLFVGMLLGIWHPTWLVFLTTPIYYLIANAIDKRLEFRRHR